MGGSKSSSKTKAYSYKCLYQEKQKSNKQPNITPQLKNKLTKPKVSRRIEIIKIRAERNNRKTREKTSMKLRVYFLKI